MLHVSALTVFLVAGFCCEMSHVLVYIGPLALLSVLILWFPCVCVHGGRFFFFFFFLVLNCCLLVLQNLLPVAIPYVVLTRCVSLFL
jgi:hypothetical protein